MILRNNGGSISLSTRIRYEGKMLVCSNSIYPWPQYNAFCTLEHDWMVKYFDNNERGFEFEKKLNVFLMGGNNIPIKKDVEIEL